MTWVESKMKDDAIIRLSMHLGITDAAKELDITPEELAREIEKVRYRYDFDYFSSERLRIIDKNGLLIPLKQNSPQKKLDLAIQRQVEKGKPIRICLLKARQWGGSTKIEGHLFRDSTLRANRSSMIVAHDLDSARHLREMSYRYYEYYDFPKPKVKKESDKWWKFQHKIEGRSADSHLRIDTADELSAGHSLTIHNLHLSEVQNWRNAQELVKGLFPTVPPSPDTMIFMEGTGSGVGNYWYDFCQMAMQEGTEWEFVFVPWFEIDDYTRDFGDGQKSSFEKTLDADEKDLFDKGISLEKLHWRRIELSETYKGDQDAFHQQYPATPDEAFITSGRPVFPLTTVKKQLNASKEGLQGYLEWKAKKVVFIPDKRGYWKTWETPDENFGNLYVCGADVAEGIEVIPELGNRGGDFSAARVFRRDKRFFCGSLHARIDPDLLAEELRKAFYYWKCPIFPEQNAGGGGNLVISRLRDDLMVKLIKTPVFGKKKELSKKDEVGWETTGGKANSTKRIAIDEMNEAIREQSYEDPDKEVWQECSTYVRDAKGATNAQSRKFDDLVMATAITLQADKLMPMVFHKTEEKRRKITRDMDVQENWKETHSRESVMEKTLVEF